MNCPLISIIVPVYQVEKYLKKCVCSIISQTYRNLEVILVDDGSTDNCPALCNQFQVDDNRIKVIHQKKGGLSHARNVGLKFATGDFISFVDSDDWLEPNMYKVLMTALMQTNADIAVCDRYIETENTTSNPSKVKSGEIKLYSPEEALRMIIKDENILHDTVWNKLYVRKVLSNINFPDGKIHEDILWTAKVVGNSRLLVCISSPLYHHLHRSDSLSQNKDLTIRRILDKIQMVKQRLEYIQEHYPALEKLAIMKFQNMYCYEYYNISMNKHLLDGDGKIRHELHRQFCQLGSHNNWNFDGLYTTLGRNLFQFSPNLFLTISVIWQKLHQLKKTIRKRCENYTFI